MNYWKTFKSPSALAISKRETHTNHKKKETFTVEQVQEKEGGIEIHQWK
ncbi:hypothetical protein QWY16_03800 [Planococcus shenhongbingii]|nr:hypothetical protein [Planococcus sp. N016]WKA59287.1 hypothetical protein QWY16_03800 [Planococcus sp. N016]